MKDLFTHLERIQRTHGKIKYKHLTVHEKINLRGNSINRWPFKLFLRQCHIRTKEIDGLYILIQYQFASKHERRVYHHQYNKKITELFNM